MSEQRGREAVDAREVVRTADASQPGFRDVLTTADVPMASEPLALTFASGGGHGAPGRPKTSGLGKHIGNTWDFFEGRAVAIPGSIALFAHTLYVGFSEIKHALDSTHNPLLQTFILLVGVPATFIAAGLMAAVNLPAQFFTGHRIDTWKIWSWKPFKKK